MKPLESSPPKAANVAMTSTAQMATMRAARDCCGAGCGVAGGPAWPTGDVLAGRLAAMLTS